MDGEKLVPHVENLVPGLSTMAALAVTFPAEVSRSISDPILLSLLAQPFLSGAILLAISYMVGAAVFALSRLVIDSASRASFRWIFLMLFRRRDFDGRGLRAVNEKYTDEIDRVLNRPPDVIGQEVFRRRQRGRVVRTLFVPLAILLYPQFLGFTNAFASACVSTLASATVTTMLYGYIEYSLYQEGRRARDVPLKPQATVPPPTHAGS